MHKVPLRLLLFRPRRLITFGLLISSVSLGVLSFAGTPQHDSDKLNAPQLSGVRKSAIHPGKIGPASNSGPGWSVVASPNTTEQQLLGTDCVSATDCWAVGYYYGLGITYSQTLVEHWNGNSWTIMSSPNVQFQGGGPAPNRLNSVACNGSADCWAVGYGQSQTALYSTLIEHWDGMSWTIVNSPSPSTVQNQLFSITCNSSADCWTVGTFRTGSNNRTTQTLIEHWDGSAWSVVSSPTTGYKLTSVTCTTSSDCWAVGYAGGGSAFQTLAEHWNGSAWSIVGSPDVSSSLNNFMTSIDCRSSTNCWAAGYYDSGNTDVNGNPIYQTLLEQWNGTAWSIVSSPNTAASDSNVLLGITCTSASQCWTVGYANGSTSETALIENWNGNSWSIVAAPTSATTQANYLNAIACSSNGQCWAVGYHDFQYTLIETWNGNGWSITSAPSAAGGGSDDYLSGVTCNSVSDCWAVGQNSLGQSFVQHWDGSKWSIVFMPVGGIQFNTLSRVRCAAANDCWAVGYYNAGSFYQTLAEHWDGHLWSEIAGPNVANQENYLLDVACASTNDCWAVGYSYNDSTNTGQVLIEHWNGSSWSIASSTNGSNAPLNELFGVSCNSASDCWAAGFFGDSIISSTTSEQTLVEHWDGSSWAIVSSPNSGQENFLNAIVCISSTQCWAVGNYDSASMIEYWDGNSWSLVASPGNGLFEDVTCDSISSCWAVGWYGSRTLTAHWDGIAWSVVPSANAQYADVSKLYGVACPSSAQCWAVGEFDVSTNPYVIPPTPIQTLIEVYSVTTPPLLNAGSRMTHSSAGTFDLNLPLTGSPGIECRRGASGNYSVIFNFANDVTSCGTAATAGGSVVSGPNSNQCTLNLTGVANGQTINVELDNVADSFNNTGNVSVPMGVLIGDTTGNGIVNSSDIAQTQSQSGQPVTQSNFREDVTVSGAINSSDVALVQSQSGTALPASPASTSSLASKAKPRRPVRNQ